MSTFESSARLQEVLGGFFGFLLEQPEMAKKLLDSKLVLKFNYTEPELSITVDLRGEGGGEKGIVTFNDTEKKADVEMKMKADVAHKFWFGKVNLVMALARREMIAKGPIPKILRLLPVIKPAYAIYPKYLQEKGFSSYVLS
ncbi:MAG: SCP2 sterol-binding domain-containing protein [Deltaproteobacteria bacterium]|nr:SCP2 sterol-binding domain-containing protein [Deltaproteobacteria bacterium]